MVMRLLTSLRILLGSSALLVATAVAAADGGAAAAERLSLLPRRQAGDAHRLALSVTTRTEALSRGASGESYEEDVRLRYEATVVVLEASSDGRPIRERHEHASLTFERPSESGSLFVEPVTYEVRRGDRLEIFQGSRRIDGELERTIARVLESQFEYTLAPAFLDPGRPVEVGESWRLDESLVRRFLASRGVKVLAFGKGASATLSRSSGESSASSLVIDYEVPIERLELTRMPPNTAASRSEARLTGRIALAAARRQPPVSARSDLKFRLSGLSRTLAQSLPWSLERSETVETMTSAAQNVVSYQPVW